MQESAEDDDLKTMFKARRADQSPPKRLKTAKTAEESSSPSDKKITEPDAVVAATQVSGPGPASLPQRPPNRRKMSLKKSLRERAKISETTHEKPHSCKKELLKVEFLTFTSPRLIQKSANFIYFYSIYRSKFLLVCRVLWYAEGAYMNGSTVLLTTPGLQRWSSLIF